MLSRFVKDLKVIPFLAIVFSIALGVYYYATLTQVPFHPDEATYNFMSNDFKKLFTQPLSMQYQSDTQSDIIQHYRLVDPALNRYVIGTALAIARISPLAVDWDWTVSWQENQDNGALPGERMLMISRLAVSIFFLFSLVFIYKTGTSLHSPLTGLLAVILLGTNALILLHTRRAMQEALLIPAICLSLWSFIGINRRPWLAGLAVMLAFNAKYSAAPLMIIGGIAIFILDNYHSVLLRKRIINILVFSLLILAGTFILNPVLWADPLNVLRIAINERSILVSSQVTALQNIDPAYALTSLDNRVAGLITHLFFSRPAALDIGNYLDVLNPSIEKYLSIPGTTLMRGPIGGLVFFFLTVFGFIMMLTRLILKRDTAEFFRSVFLLGFVILFIALSVTVTLPFQRYVLPLLPFTSLLSAYGLSQIVLPNKKAP